QDDEQLTTPTTRVLRRLARVSRVLRCGVCRVHLAYSLVDARALRFLFRVVRGRGELLRGEFQNLLHLPVPVGPTVRAGQLAELVRNFLLDEERREVAAVRDEEVFRAAVEIKIGQRGDAFRRHLARDAEDVVRASHFASGGAVDARD